ncbi:MAG: hypothetical protein QGH25_12640, partial [Candidatus Latescibacteria bacterium]|nr:hypothetical protein [Candidatus Latescibacterota bacterium]
FGSAETDMTLPGTNGVSPEVEIRREAKGGYADNNTRRLKQQKTKALSVSGEHEIGVADQY